MVLKSKDVDNGVKVSNELNFLGTGTFVEGTVETKGSLRIDGRVKGAVKTADTLTIGAKGEVYGEVQARMAIVGGKIDGNVDAEEKLVLEANSILIGNLKTKKLVIDDGAIFQGKSDMGAPKQAKKETSPLDFQPKGENRGEAGTSEKKE